MFDKMAISNRFFSCYPGKSRRDMARIFGVCKATVTEWAREGNVPWSKLKCLSDSQAVSWDWLLDGMEPKESAKEAIVYDSTKPKFDSAGINQRFLSLFPDMTQTQIAHALGVTPGAVHEWHKNICQVSWQRLLDATETFGVRWDWLIDGLGPKLRA